MKICLVPYTIVSDVADNEISMDGIHPYIHLGFLTIGALLDRAGHDVIILDPVWEAFAGQQDKSILDNPYHVAELIRDKKPDLVGFSTMIISYPHTIKWAEYFHLLSPKTPIVLGGPQATVTDEQTLRAFPWIDMVLRGEVENSIIPLIDCLQSGSNLANVPGLTWNSKGKIIKNPDAPVVTDLDTLPSPAYHLLQKEQITRLFSTETDPSASAFPLEAGRGCPFHCTFCSTSSYFQRTYRAKSVDRLIGEMADLHDRYGLTRFSLNHDLFTYNQSYVLEFCKRLQEKGFHKLFKWDCSARINTVNYDLLAEMAAAGCIGIFYGIETGSQRMQRLIRKNLPVQQIKLVVEETQSLGIHVSGSLICGFPLEDREDLSASLNLAMDLVSSGATVAFYPLGALVGSELYRDYRDTIHHDGRWTSITVNYLSQESQKLVFGWPDVFDSFYHFETPHLSYDVLRVLIRMFWTHSRLLTAMSRSGIEVMSVLERWPEWYRIRLPNPPEFYYASSSFQSDILKFLCEDLEANKIMTPVIEDILRYYVTMDRTLYVSEEAPILPETYNIDVLATMALLLEGKPPFDDVLKPTTYLFWNTNGKVISQRLTPDLSELLKIPLP